MRYEYLISRNLALLDLPEKYEQVKQNTFSRIFKQLLVFDQLPDQNYEHVLAEASQTLEMADPAFEFLPNFQFEQFILSERHRYVWQKANKDYHAYISFDSKRRNSENPYFNPAPKKARSWDILPDFTRPKRNQPWQFDNLYRDAQILAGTVYELLSRFEDKNDKDLFRAKVNSILVPDKIIFALNSNETEFAENEVSLVNIKLALDAYKQAWIFLDRVVETLHKIRWSRKDYLEPIDQIISFSDRLLERVKIRVLEYERRFMLFIEAIEDQNRPEEE